MVQSEAIHESLQLTVTVSRKRVDFNFWYIRKKEAKQFEMIVWKMVISNHFFAIYIIM